MSDLKLGVLIDASAQRDAIHIAVAPVVASQILAPGDHVGFLPGSTEGVAAAGTAATPIGIVDPFLKDYVQVGERFWMFLYPQTITSLRHDWTHPAFASAPVAVVTDDKAASEKWLREFAEEVGVSYGVLMDAAEEWLTLGEYYTFRGRDTPKAVYIKREEMWKHYEIVTGTKVDDHESTFFTCAC